MLTISAGVLFWNQVSLDLQDNDQEKIWLFSDPIIVFVVLQIEEEFRSVAASFGIDYDAMCVTDNTNCDGEPWINYHNDYVHNF